MEQDGRLGPRREVDPDGPVPATEQAVARVSRARARHGDLGEARSAAEATARRRLRLLWEPPAPSPRGRPARFTLDDVVAAGVDVADERGLAALSMRKVAEALGTSPMSLYTYVESREELVELMVDGVYATVEHPPPGAPWRDALRRVALGRWDLYRRHPWLLDLNMWRLPLGPHVLDDEEAGYAALADTGLSPRGIVEVLAVVDGFVQGAARAAAAESREHRTTGLSADDYWSASSSFWMTYFDPERYPTLTRIWAGGGFDRSATDVEPELDRLLDAVTSALPGPKT